MRESTLRELTLRLKNAAPTLQLEESADMARYTTLHLGGPADLMANPDDPAQIPLLIETARALDVPVTVIGNGSNTLVRDSGFPGMKVLEFAFDSRDTGSASDYLPHNYPVNSVAYTGTHDNETLVSWYQTVTDAERAMVRDYLYDYATPEEQLYKSMIALILRSAAATCIIPMQDWLGLDNSARINKPSTVGQNWRWRLKKTQLTKKLQKEICQLTTRYGRMNWA